MDASWESLNYTTCGVDTDEMRRHLSRTQEHAATANSNIQFIMKLLEDCRYRKAHTPPPEGLHCPLTFDGLSCWNYTPAGETAYLPCPYFMAGFDPRRKYFPFFLIKYLMGAFHV